MKRTVHAIVSDILPLKSAKKYDENWEQFCSYVSLKDKRPGEEDFLQYFDHLRHERKLASSTLWSIYSMINHHYQLHFGQKLQMYPRLTMLLKSFEQGYIRKSAGVFSKEQVIRFLSTAPNEGEHVHMKAGVVLSFCGGLRCADLVGINVDDLEFNETTGFWVSYNVSKQRGEEIKNKFNVPIAYCQYLKDYLDKLTENKLFEGRLMKTYRTTKSGIGYYTKQPMGVHVLAKFTVKMALFLKLENPTSFTGHAMRRSAANVLAEAGASNAMMKKHFNWKSESTSNKYIDNTKNAKLVISSMMDPNSTRAETSSASTSSKVESKIINIQNCQNIILNL